MNEEYRKKLVPAELNWLVINNLQKFDDKPLLIEDLYLKISKLSNHPILSMFIDYYKVAYTEYYDKHKKFPDMAWLDANFKQSKPLKVLDNAFSMTIYEDLIKVVDREILRLEVANKFVDEELPTIEDIKELTNKMSKFANSSQEVPTVTKDSLLNMYAKFKEDYKGVHTYIKPLDDAIGNIGYKSLTVLACPSGHGKTTLSLSAAYNAAVYGGFCIDYITYEVSKENIWFNLASIESSVENINIEASKIKSASLTEHEEEQLYNCIDSITKKLNASGGFINIIDQTSLRVDSFEGLCTKLESMAEERGRDADLIIVDNVDSFKMLKSNERDESVKVNNCVIELDSFCKKYRNGVGTAVLLLSQVNRTGMKKLQDSATSKDTKVVIDFTVVQKYNALFERAECVLVGYADENMRSIGRMNMHVVKNRNRQVPLEPIKLHAKYAYSRIGGDIDERELSTSLDRVEDYFKKSNNYTDDTNNTNSSLNDTVDEDLENMLSDDDIEV